MSVCVRLFAAFREAAGAPELELPATDGLTVGEVWANLSARFPELKAHPPSAAVNARYVTLSTPVADGDEVAFLPPVSGG